MRDLTDIERYRRRTIEVLAFYGSYGDKNNGVFDFISPQTGAWLMVIASTGMEWDHVSVSVKHRCPNWTEMDFVKRMFFNDDETAMQLHVPVNEHLSFAGTTLHLWRPQKQPIPRPPNLLVGAPMVDNVNNMDGDNDRQREI